MSYALTYVWWGALDVCTSGRHILSLPRGRDSVPIAVLHPSLAVFAFDEDSPASPATADVPETLDFPLSGRSCRFSWGFPCHNEWEQRVRQSLYVKVNFIDTCMCGARVAYS